MNVLVVNSGSSSLKFKLFNSSSEEVISFGEIKNYSEESIIVDIDSKEEVLDISNWKRRFNFIEKVLKKKEIDAVLHRVVHGGEIYALPIVLNPGIVEKMREELFDLAPIHNPFAFEIIDESFKTYPNAKQIAVFDSSFGLTMPEENYLYALPYEYYKKYKVRKYAFHGLSHKFISKSYHNYILDDQEIYSNSHSQDGGLDSIRIVSLHLGSGCSTCAIKGTQCVDTSFGFTPEENLVMSTRVGEIDYSAVEYIKIKEKLSDKDITTLLNKKSGLLGLSGYSKDMKTLLKDYNSNPKAKLAVDIFINNVVKETLGMVSSLNGLDVLIFTGGIGQGSDIIRRMVCERLGILEVYIDVDKNEKSSDSKDILNVTGKRSKAEIFVIPTNEEKEMLEECSELLN